MGGATSTASKVMPSQFHRVSLRVASRVGQERSTRCAVCWTATSAPDDEVTKARAAVGKESTIFSKIINREIAADIIYEDDLAVAFRDAAPVAPVHVLVIPRKPLPMLSQAGCKDTELLGHLLQVARQIADGERLEKGYRIVINNGEHGAQSVHHLHVHLIGGRPLSWPPG